MKETTLQLYKERMLRVLVHLQQHLDEPMALDELARLAHLSPHHFHHVFSGMLGESLAAHIRRLRIERAAWRLKLGRLPVVQVALEAGYETHEAFSRAFRVAFGVSPMQYRRRNAAPVVSSAASGVHYQPDAAVRNYRTPRRKVAKMNVSIKLIKSLRVAFMRHVGPYDQVGKAWDRFTTFLGKEGYLRAGVQFIGICHDDPAVTSPGRIRYDACVTVDGEFEARGDIGVQRIAGGYYAVLTHFGSYETLGASYAKLLGEWLPRNGRALRSTPCFEMYFNSPENTECDDLVTDIHAPLEST